MKQREYLMKIMRYNRTSSLYSLARHESRYSTVPRPIEMVIDDMKEFIIIDYLLRDKFNEQDTKSENNNRS
jgi:hypothetical protein